jgi:hypothetical protein
MEQGFKNSSNAAGRVFNQLAAEKKKTIMALCLVALMVFMWVRTLSKKTPNTATAAVVTQPSETDIAKSDSQLNISFVKLPNIKGRNDILTRDFFASNDWQGFIKEGEYEGSGSSGKVDVVSGGGSGEVVKSAAERLKLEAIESGENPQAFINGKLLSAGDKLSVADAKSGKEYEFEVIKIEQNVVFLKSGKIEVKLELMQGIEVSDD